LSQGFGPAGYPTKPPASYRANRPLPGWDFHPRGVRAVRGAPERTEQKRPASTEKLRHVAMEAVHQARHVEVQQQTDVDPAHAQVRSELHSMDSQDGADGFDFQNKLARDDNIRLEAVADFRALIEDGNCELP